MSGGPKNASLTGDGFRFYRWEEPGVEPTDVLSVTSIRKLCGEPYTLVAWQISNVVNAAMGTTAREVIGPRGGRSTTYVREQEGPGEFVRRMTGAKSQAAYDDTRAWLRQAADTPRDIAAIRGTLVHEAIELSAPLVSIDQAYVEKAIDRLGQRDKAKVKKLGGVTDDDVDFIRRCVGQYWDMRAKVPFVILAREPQVWNLTAGYAGSGDVLIWFLGDWVEGEIGDNENGEPVFETRFDPLPDLVGSLHRAGIIDRTVTAANVMGVLQRAADKGVLTQDHINAIGGHVTLGDWKTSKGVYTDQVVQVHAYLGAEFVGADGKRDDRLTRILLAAAKAAIIHIRPDGWTIHFVDFEVNVLRAFLGSVAFARFLATYPEPQPLFTHDVTGFTSEDPPR